MKATRLFTINLDPIVHNKLKHLAVDEDRPVSEIVRDLIDAYLATKVKEK